MKIEKLEINVDLRKIHLIRTISNFVSSEKVIIFVHGFGLSKDDWPLYPDLENAFLKNGTDVIRFDLSGFGENERELLSYKTHTLDILSVYNWAQYIGYKSISTVTFSYGGFVALEVQHNLLNSLVLWAPPLKMKENILRKTSPINRILWKFFQNTVISHEATLRPSLMNYKFVNELSKVRSEKNLEKMKIPVLILQGTDDKEALVTTNRSVVNKIKNSPNIEYYEIKEADHGISEKFRTDFNNRTIEFVNKNWRG